MTLPLVATPADPSGMLGTLNTIILEFNTLGLTPAIATMQGPLDGAGLAQTLNTMVNAINATQGPTAWIPLVSMATPAADQVYYLNNLINAINGLSGGTSQNQVISMTKRLTIPRGVVSVGANNINSTRVMETNIQASPGGFWIEDFNGWVNTSIATASDELTAGSAGLTTYTLLYNVSGTGYAQTSATALQVTFNGIINSTAGYCYKYTPGTSPTLVSRTYAQFQADGGYIVARGSGWQINRPDGYYIRSDLITTAIPAGALAIQVDDVRPLPITITNLVQSGGTATATCASTAGIISGCYYNMLGNTPSGYNVSNVQVTVTSGTTFTYAVNASTATPATTTGTFNFVRPYAASALNARGDILKQTPVLVPSAASESGTTVTVTVPSTSTMTTGQYYDMSGFAPAGFNGTYAVTVVNGTTFSYTAGSSGLGTASTLGTAQINLVQHLDWSSVNTGLTTNGELTSSCVMVCGLGSGGMVGVAGDSNAFNGDTNQLNPSGAYFLGDSDAAVGYIPRALNGWGYSFCNVAVVGRSPAPQVTYGGGQVSRWMIRNCKTTWDEMGRNYAIAGGNTYSGMITVMTAYYAQIRSAVSGIRIVSHTFPPLTSSTDTWETGTNQTQNYANITYPSGWTYATYTPAQLSVGQGGNGNFNGASNGGADYVYNLQASIRNLCGAAAVDGLWAYNGTAWEATFDGQHMSYLNHIYAAADLNTNYSAKTVLGF